MHKFLEIIRIIIKYLKLQHICNYAAMTPTTSISTDKIERTITVNLAKHCIELPDDGSLVIRNMLEQF